MRPRAPLNRKDFPKVKFWLQHEYRAFCKTNKTITDPTTSHKIVRGSTRAAQGINVTMLYVEDDDGVPVDGYRATTIRHHAHAIFARVHELGLAPPTWGAASTDVKNAYIEEMEETFEELQRCASSWKALKIATTIYPSWYRNHVLQLDSPEDHSDEDDDDDDDNPDDNQVETHSQSPQGEKRPRTSNSGPRKKSRKTQPKAVSLTLCACLLSSHMHDCPCILPELARNGTYR